MDTRKNLYIISFGTSSKYRFYADKEDFDKLNGDTEIKRYLQHRFPDGGEMKFLVTPDVTRIAPENESEYSSYPLLDAETLKRIEAHLAAEHEAMRNTADMNSDAPYDAINPNAID